MDALQRATAPQFPQFRRREWKPHKHRPVCCFGLENHNSIELHQSMDDGSERSHNGIWRLFTEAQRNIIYLNRQRIQAIQQLDEMKREQKALLEKIEQLEGQAHASSEEDPFSISSELLLRIDSMVLTGFIDTKEASGFRNLVTNTKLV